MKYIFGHEVTRKGGLSFIDSLIGTPEPILCCGVVDKSFSDAVMIADLVCLRRGSSQ